MAQNNYSNNYGSILSSIGQAMGGLTMIDDGIDIIKQGASYQAGVYRQSGQIAQEGAAFQAQVDRQAGQAALIAANYNIALDQVDTGRQNEALGRQLADVTSSNYATTAAHGISISSKSTMMVQNDIITTTARQVIRNNNDAHQRQSLIDYQGKLTQVQYENQARADEYSGAVANLNYENQARAAEYQGEVDAYKQEAQRAQTIGSTVGNIFGMMGGG